MAGTLTISTLSDGTNSTSATNCIQGSAKAWVNFNGMSGASVRTSYNVSSVTRTGTGVYTVSFTNAFTDANYSMAGTAQRNDGLNWTLSVSPSPATAQTSSNAYICTGYAGSQASQGYNIDAIIVSVQFFR